MATVVVMQEIRPLENRRGICVPTWALLCSFARDTKEAGKQWDESLCRIGEDFKTQSDMLARLWPKWELKRGHSTLPSAPASLHHPSSWHIIFQEVFPYSCFPELVNQKSARNFARPGVLESCLFCISLTTPGSEPHSRENGSRTVPTVFFNCVQGRADQGRSLHESSWQPKVFEEELLEIIVLTQTVKPLTEGHHIHLS